MDRDLIARMMERHGVTTYADPANARARKGFEFCMRNKQYGYEALESAWSAFLDGWNAHDDYGRLIE